MSAIRQIYCTVIICSLCMNSELMFAWPSSTLTLFSSNTTSLNRPMTETELSFFGSLSSIAAVASTPLTGVLLDLLGRKYCCILFALPPVIAWSLVSILPRVEAILTAVFLSGLSGCSFMIVPNFISELSQEDLRGSLTACGIIFSSIGLLMSYILGGFLEYDMMNYVCLTMSVAALVMLTLVKESPVHLMKKGLEKEAAESICFYRSIKPNSEAVVREIQAIRKILTPPVEYVCLNTWTEYISSDIYRILIVCTLLFLWDIIKKDIAQGMTPEEETLKPESRGLKKNTKLQFLKKSKSTHRGLAIIITLYTLSAFQGLIIVQVYSKPLFEQALPNSSANLITIMFALVNVLSGFASAYLLDYFGRRPVIIYSSIGTFLVSIALGTQIHLYWGPSWLSVMFVFLYCFTTTCGAANVPSVMVSELFLPEIRGLMTMLTIEWSWLCNFLMLFIFHPFVAVIGLGPVFYVFAIFSLMCAIFSLFYVPETKGLTLDVIQTILLKGKQF